MREITLEVPSPARPERLDRFLVANVAGLSRRKIKALLDAGQVRVADRVERRAGRALRTGEVVQLSFRPSLLDSPSLSEADIIARGPGWLAVHKPTGLPTHRTEEGGTGVPEALGMDLLVVHRLDRGTSGVLLLALDRDAAAHLAAQFADRAIKKTYRAIVSPAPLQDAGQREDPDERGPIHLSWTLLRRSADGRRAELAVEPREGRTHQVRRQLAAAGTPIVGDLVYGRALPDGAARLGLHCEALRWDGHEVIAPPPAGWDELIQGVVPPASPALPDRPARQAPPRPASGPLRRLKISRASARILRSGHPWVLPDRDTGDLGRFTAGDQALLVDQAGDAVGVALIDPAASVCARLLALDRTEPITDEDVHRRVSAALERRRPLLDDPATDCLRLVNAEADGLPGLVIDQWGDLRVATRATHAVSQLTHAAFTALDEALGAGPLYEKDHVQDLRARGQGQEGDALPGRWLRGAEPKAPLVVREDGLAYRVTPWAGLTTGLYPDQRENRRRMVQRLAPGARVLNLFAHTGAFSVRAAAAGAQRATSVDLSPRYCDWTSENLLRNRLDPAQHPVIAAASDVWLAQTEERFDFVVLDPPAFARGRGGSRGWNARRDYRSLVAACAAVLPPEGGWLLAIVNLKGLKPGWLRQQVEAGLRDGGRMAGSVLDAPPSVDTPGLRGFPEGIAFRGVLVQVRAA